MPNSKKVKAPEGLAWAPVFSSSAINSQLGRILCSPEFHATEAQRAFLQYVIDKTLLGQMEEIKGYTIATCVFGRCDDFDQARDPIVSIQANKLRRALERYYLVEGHHDPICITIPKGAYVPVFTGQNYQTLESVPRSQASTADKQAWPTIKVRSFVNQTSVKELDYIGVGLATEIALEITHHQEIRVLRHDEESNTQYTHESKARFMLEGSIKKSATGLKVLVRLTDLATNIQIWGDSCHTDLAPAEVAAFEERVAKTIVGKISCETGIIVKTLSNESKRIPPSSLKTHQAMLRFYQFQSDFTVETFVAAYQALQQACRNEPECGLIWSMLARLYGINYSLELFDLKTSLEEAASFAEKGVQLEPANQRVRLIKAFVLLLRNELSAGLTELDFALSLNPKSLLCLEHIGYLMTLLGDWQRGPALINRAIEQNPYYNTTAHHALWLDWLRQGQYEHAYLETLHFSRPTLFWDPLLKAAILGLLGRIEEGKAAGKELLKCKPDFHSRGHILMRHYIKQENVAAKIISGLEKVGIVLPQAAIK